VCGGVFFKLMTWPAKAFCKAAFLIGEMRTFEGQGFDLTPLFLAATLGIFVDFGVVALFLILFGVVLATLLLLGVSFLPHFQ